MNGMRRSRIVNSQETLRKPYLFFSVLIFLAPLLCFGEETGDSRRQRALMVRQQIVERGITDEGVLKAMKKVPRHCFVPQRHRALSYADQPLPIGKGQTISQPYIVAFMTEALKLKPDDKLLEVGTGSGYQAAVLAELVSEVYTIELIESLGKRARQVLDELSYRNIHSKIGDGYKGWPEMAPFDAIIVTCAPERVPQTLIEQLREGGRMIIPVGRTGAVQRLVMGVKKKGRLETEAVMLVRFVPMIKGRD